MYVYSSLNEHVTANRNECAPLCVIHFPGNVHTLSALMYLLSSNCLPFALQTLPSRYTYATAWVYLTGNLATGPLSRGNHNFLTP